MSTRVASLWQSSSCKTSIEVCSGSMFLTKMIYAHKCLKNWYVAFRLFFFAVYGICFVSSVQYQPLSHVMALDNILQTFMFVMCLNVIPWAWQMAINKKFNHIQCLHFGRLQRLIQRCISNREPCGYSHVYKIFVACVHA